jgi:putative membrane protein
MIASLQSATLLAGSGDWDHGWVWPFWMLLWIGLVGLVIWLVVRRIRPHEPSGLDRAKQILAERYARGELSGDEYRERLADLG